jgi:electron-transferring-flavoprotein dehydrogenase
MAYDVVIVGAGPAGLAAGIRLKQLAEEKGREISVCILEKGSEVGAHILSGAVIDPRAIDELLPKWKDLDSPLTVPVIENRHWVLTKNKKYELPHIMMPPFMSNKGTYTASLGNFCRWLAGQAEALGVEIFPGFAAGEVLYNDDGLREGRRDRATWGGRPRRAATSPIISRAWSFTAATPSSPKARAVTLPSR